MKLLFRRILLAAALLTSAVAPLAAQTTLTEYEGASALGLALRRVGMTKRVLMIGAHPDDEDTQFLASLALGQGADVAYLSLTRGEGGQNAIGSDQQEALGLVRTEELLAARRIDGAQQLFARAYDYGFSKTADEAFRHWPHDTLLYDVVSIIRKYRPDVIVSVFSGTPRDGHGQHQASGVVAREAFDAAADPTKFPDQIARGLQPFSVKKYYLSTRGSQSDSSMRVNSGQFDPVFGRSYAQVASLSRSRHRSQDQGGIIPLGPRFTSVRLIAQHDAAASGSSLFAGVDTTLSTRAVRLPDEGRAVGLLASYDSIIAQVQAQADLRAPNRIAPALARALTILQQASEAATSPELGFTIGNEIRDATDALARANEIVLDAVADQEKIVPGQTFVVDVILWNGGRQPVSVRSLAPAVAQGWQVAADSSAAAATVQPGNLLSRRFHISVPANASITNPYYLREPRKGDMYVWRDMSVAGLPFEPPPVQGAAEIQIDDATATLTREAVNRTANPSLGEVRRPIRVVPAVTVALEPAAAVLSTRDRLPLRFTVHVTDESSAPANGVLRIEAPAGWVVQPQNLPVRLAAGETQGVSVTVRRPPVVSVGAYRVAAIFEADNGQHYTQGYRLIDYPHIRPHPLYRDADAVVNAADVALPVAHKIGYVMGAGDEVPQALAQLGMGVDMLDAPALTAGDLSRYDAIVIGVRAYETRPDLRAQNKRLLDYVQRGGTLVVQYGQNEYASGKYSPYPMTFARPADRVTDEDAAVKFLDPASPLIAGPNKLSASDFNGWVQERGLWYPSTWDARYKPLLEMGDPGEAPLKGGLLITPYGKGTYIYTGLSLFRQLPAGVPGAYRLLSNLLSAGVKPKS
jgi:LmbE family N-acetylglucosaminyl deacetylase